MDLRDAAPPVRLDGATLLDRRILPLLVALFMLGLSIAQRLEVGPVSVAILEPFALAVAGAAALLALMRGSWRRLSLLRSPMVWPWLAILLWAALVRPLAPARMHGLSDVRDWVIPVAVMTLLLLSVRTGWRRLVLLFVGVELFQLGIAYFQAVTGRFYPIFVESARYKVNYFLGYDNSPIRAHPAVGLLGHPAYLGEFLFVGWLLVLVVPLPSPARWIRAALALLFGVAIFLTFSKVSLLLMAPAAALVLLLRRPRAQLTGRALLTLAGITAAVAVGFLVILRLVNATYLLNTFYWRLTQWEIVGTALERFPQIWLTGNGFDLAFQAGLTNSNPHNLYLFFLLQYGVVGLTLLLLFLAGLVRVGWRHYQQGLMRREPVLAALWVTLASLMVFALMGTSLSYIDYRALYLLLVALYLGLAREVQTEMASAASAAGSHSGDGVDAEG